MSKILALLSGKGGSGKTTLALSMASMLSNCGIRVLLVDCDLSTNGATYFYEDKLDEYRESINSFYNVIFNISNGKEQVIKINEYMNFMPSIIQITRENTETYSYNKIDCEILHDFKKNYEKQYDIIIFDCQAGYTDILRLILPIVDINLVVMEADAISSSAIRSLYLKIGEFLNEKNIYQVFNKVTEDEYEIYSKLSGGTVFTNVETVIFDWKIRKAFSVAEIPDMENASANYGVQIYNICKILFKESIVQEKLNKYGLRIELNRKIEEEAQLEEKINAIHEERSVSKNKFYKMLLSMSACFVGTMMCYLFYEMVNQRVLAAKIETNIFLVMIFIIVVTVFLIVMFYFMDISKDRMSYYSQIDMYKKQLRIIKENKQKLLEKCDGMSEEKR